MPALEAVESGQEVPFPDIGREELIRLFTLTRKDLGFIDNLDRGGGRGPAARLGLAVQLRTLPWLGFVPDGIWAVPQAAGSRRPRT